MHQIVLCFGFLFMLSIQGQSNPPAPSSGNVKQESRDDASEKDDLDRLNDSHRSFQADGEQPAHAPDKTVLQDVGKESSRPNQSPPEKERGLDYWWIQPFLSLALIVATIVLVVFTKGLEQAAQEQNRLLNWQNDIAEKQTQILNHQQDLSEKQRQLDERTFYAQYGPKLRIREIVFEDIDRNQNLDEVKEFVIKGNEPSILVIENTGQAPGFIVGSFVGFQLPMSEHPIIVSGAFTETPRTKVSPGERVPFEVPKKASVPPPSARQRLIQVVNSSKVVFMYGAIKYEDEAGTTHIATISERLNRTSRRFERVE